MKKGIWMTGVCVMAWGMVLLNPTAASAAVVPEGIYVGGQSLGGMDTEEAKEAVDAYVSKMSGQSITLDVAGTKVETTADQLGFHWENSSIVEDTVSQYSTGNVISRYLKKKDLAKSPVDVKLELKIDGNAVAEFVKTQCEPLMQEAVDATIVRENGEFIVTPSQDGLSVDLEATTQKLNEVLGDGLEEPVLVEAEVVVERPARTTEMLSTIQDVLGTFSTDFSSSGASRSKNLKVGSGKINGAVLMPGETLSGYEYMHPFTIANGYANAAAYENGQVVDSIGGGVCQIATTLYNAALLAELEITQRQNHSMIVTYVKPSQDAAIAGTYKDIKVTNPYDTPIYIEAGTEGRKLFFTIYGQETRPENRTIKYVSETLKVIDPGEPITQEDATLAPGERVRVQSSHTGYKSQLWKYVYVDGVETEKILLNSDTYNASKAIYRVGPAAVETVPAETTATDTAVTEPGEIGPGAGSPAPETEIGPGAGGSSAETQSGEIGPGM